MEKIGCLNDLQEKRKVLQSNLKLRTKAEQVEDLIQIKVAMATCGIASGAKQVMEVLIEECNRHNIDAVITQTDCLGHCNAEPTVIIQKPKQTPIIFGYVTPQKAKDLVLKYIIKDEMLEGVIPANS